MHERILAEGSFRVVLTERNRLVAALDAHTALGPVHIAYEVADGHIRRLAAQEALEQRRKLRAAQQPYRPRAYRQRFDQLAYETGFDPVYAYAMGFDPEYGYTTGFLKAIGKGLEGAFNAASKAVTTVARPAFTLVQKAAGAGAGLIAKAPFLPPAARRQFQAASRVIMRARLGDITAKQFIRSVVKAAKAGVASARVIGDALAKAGKFVGNLAIAPLVKLNKLGGAISRGDWKAVKRIGLEELSNAQGVLSFIPGIGTGISAAISAGVAVLEGGGPLEIAIRTAYGAIPIPPGVRTATDAALGAILKLASGGKATDVALAGAREAVPDGLPRKVFDTLAQILVKRVPIQKVGANMLEHYVKQYGGDALKPVTQVLQLPAAPSIVAPDSRLLRALQFAPAAASA